MDWFGRKSKAFRSWLQTASDQELRDAYEERRLEWLRNSQNGTGIKTPEMQAIDREMTRRAEERWENDPRRIKDPNYRWTDANRWERD